MTGKVYLVGAGPGDPELLTLKAVKAIGGAQVILADALVSDEVLGYARADARIVRVGKRGGRASTEQAFIEHLMISEARHGRIVVRLKGGDPMIFGRGGEECAALRAAGIPFEVVNGITSGLAAATVAGIPLTHRGHGHGTIFVTGTANDWRALAATGFPLVIYMGVARCAAIEQALLEGGMRRDTAVAAIGNATRHDQRIVTTRLDRMAEDLRASDIGSPAILVVGSIAASAAVEMAHEVQEHVAG